MEKSILSVLKRERERILKDIEKESTFNDCQRYSGLISLLLTFEQNIRVLESEQKRELEEKEYRESLNKDTDESFSLDGMN